MSPADTNTVAYNRPFVSPDAIVVDLDGRDLVVVIVAVTKAASTYVAEVCDLRHFHPIAVKVFVPKELEMVGLGLCLKNLVNIIDYHE